MIDYNISEPELLGNYIKTNRENLNLSAKQLAMMMNVSPAAVSGWESGIKTPDIYKCCVLAQLFGVTIDQFYSCRFSESMRFKGSKLYDYLNQKKDGCISFEFLPKKNKHRVLTDLINCIKSIIQMFDNLYEKNDVNATEFEYLSSLLGFNVMYNFGPYIISVVEKVDANFNFYDLKDSNWDFTVGESKKGNKCGEPLFDIDMYDEFTTMMLEKMIYFSNERIDVAYDEIVCDKRIPGEMYDVAYIKDKKGRIARIKIYEFEDGDSLKILYSNFEKHREIKKQFKDVFNLMDFIHFDVVMSFVDILFDEDYNQYLNELLKILGSEMKSRLYYDYINKCKKTLYVPKTEILYHFLINGVIKDNKIIQKVCKAVHDNKETIILYDEEEL